VYFWRGVMRAGFLVPTSNVAPTHRVSGPFGRNCKIDMATDLSWGLSMPPRHLLKNAALFLDFDGTIIALAARPDAIQVDQLLRRLVDRLLVTLQGRVAVISGRPVSEIQYYLDNPDLIVAGSHGLEIHWPDGRSWTLQKPTSIEFLRDELRDLPLLHPGVLIEEKPFGVAIHYRQRPQAQEECRRRAIDLSQRTNLRLQPGKMVFELKAPGADKGSAIDMLMKTPPMLGYIPLFLGDDDTDEAGFVAAANGGGAGILVGAPRRTAALYGLPAVQDAIDWLDTAERAQ
jgi:trehalose 6-phosphate phosphatase